MNDTTASKKVVLGLAKWACVALVIYFVYVRFSNELKGLSLDEMVIDPWFTLLGFLVFVTYLSFAALIWFYLTKMTRVSLGLRQTVSIWFYSILGKYVPGKALLWGIRLFLYKKKKPEISTIGLVNCFCVEYLVGIAAGLTLVIASFPLLGTTSVSTDILIWSFAALLISLAIVHPAIANRIVGIIAKKFGTEVPADSFSQTHLIEILILCLLNWLVLGLSVFFFAKGISPTLSYTSILYVSASYTLAGILGFLAFFAPSGIGVREAILIETMSRIIPVKEAVILAVIARLAMTLAEIGVAGIAWLADKGNREAGAFQNRSQARSIKEAE